MIALPVVPVDSVSKAFMFPFQIEPIQVRVMASTIPPGSFESENSRLINFPIYFR